MLTPEKMGKRTRSRLGKWPLFRSVSTRCLSLSLTSVDILVRIASHDTIYWGSDAGITSSALAGSVVSATVPKRSVG
jgi:hypothetical protein